MTDADILRKAKEHISDPAMWFQCGYTADLPDDDIDRLPRKHEACCGIGAVLWVAKKLGHSAEVYLHEAAIGRRFLDYVALNDHPDTTHADVMAVFDEAIKLAEGE